MLEMKKKRMNGHYIAIVPGYEAEHLIYIYPEDCFVAAFATRAKITSIFKTFSREKTEELIRKKIPSK